MSYRRGHYKVVKARNNSILTLIKDINKVKHTILMVNRVINTVTNLKPTRISYKHQKLVGQIKTRKFNKIKQNIIKQIKFIKLMLNKEKKTILTTKPIN